MKRSTPSLPATHPANLPCRLLLLLLVIAVNAAGLCQPSRADTAGSVPAAPVPAEWGEPVPGADKRYAIYAETYSYGTAPLLITDTRQDDGGQVYSDKESYDILTLTVYRAHDGEALLEHQPVLFYVHGGGWTDGYRDWYEFVAQPFTGEKGWVTVVIDYRLTSSDVYLADGYCPDRETCTLPANEALRTKAAWYPDNIADVASAFDWVKENLAGYGGDPDRVVAFGHSAGAHLVSLLATHQDYTGGAPADLLGVISMSGAYDLAEMNHVFWGSAVSQTYMEGFADEATLADASPAAWVTGDQTLPPFYLLYAEDDLLNLTEQHLAFRSQLEQAGHQVDSTYLAGYGHVSEMDAISDIDELPTRLIVEWIERLVAPRLFLPLLLA